MNDLIQRTERFLKEKFWQSEYFKEHPQEMTYRLEHSYRVANIGKQIAEKEGMDVTAMVIGCLLHDVSYCMGLVTREDGRNHGRYAAKIARSFLEELGLEVAKVEDICYGIAIHVDDEADFQGERTLFALTIGDADNIDRFDAYRIYETLKWVKYDKLSKEEKEAYVNGTISKLQQFKEMEIATPTGREMWLEKLEFQIKFYERLKCQIDMSRL